MDAEFDMIGVDGCRAGWLCAMRKGRDRPIVIRIVPQFHDVIAQASRRGIIGIDMPIGLPERIIGGGRPAEMAVRSRLGARQSSVFAIPSRAAVYAVAPQPIGMPALIAGHQRASAIARKTSDPPRAIAFQAFNLFPKIREIDVFLRDNPAWVERVFETHPEAAFWRMNGETPPTTPKKIKGRVNPDGVAERRALLIAHSVEAGAIDADPPRGSAKDDQLDALACLVAAEQIAAGRGRAHPEPPEFDGLGLPIAIWTWR